MISSKAHVKLEILWLFLMIIMLCILFLCSCKKVPKTSCYANLANIDGAKEIWAAQKHATNGTSVSEMELRPYLRNKVFPKCPSDGKYTIGKIGEIPTCSLSIHKYP